MKHRIAINRWIRTLTLAGQSLNVTIPSDLLKQWGAKQGEKMAVYEVDGVLLVLPLEKLTQVGELEFLAPFKAMLNERDR